MRQRIFEIIEVGKDDDKLSKVYDLLMMICIVVSIAPLTLKSAGDIGNMIDKVTVTIFIIDYLLRLATADYKIQKGIISFVAFPFSFMAIIDLLSILPSLVMLNKGLRVLKIFRLFRTFRVFRALKVFKAFRYSKNIDIILNVFKAQKDSLLVVCWLAVGYVFVCALLIFNIEPDTFPSFFDAIYWAVVSLTTVGYGDVFCVSVVGKVITMVSAIFGIAIVALPAGIITAGYMTEVGKQKEEENK